MSDYQLIDVVSVERGRVGCYENNPAHPPSPLFPGGKCAFVYWDMNNPNTPAPVTVALTPYIAGRIACRAIREVPRPEPVEEKKQDQEQDQVKPRFRK